MPQWTERRPAEDFYRVLDPDGDPVDDLPSVADDEETLRRMYRTMLQTRALDEKTLRMQRRGEVSIIARSTGEEAVACGSAAALAPGDWCFPTYRQTSALLYWNARMDRAIAGLMGAEPETINEHLPLEGEPEVTFTPVYVPLAVNVANAVGSAMVDRFQGDDRVTLSYIGDGSTSEGDFHEALNFAGVFEAPAVTICQNNQWAISVPAHRQTAAETFARKAEAHGVPHERVDGNDVLAVYEATREAVERARDGGGPTFIEAVTYRMVEHNTADEESVYRDEDERDYWEDKDPVDRLEAFLLDRGVIDDEDPERYREALREEVQEAVDRAREVPISDPETMFDNHLQATSWSERHQRQELAAERAGANPFADFTGEGLE